MSTKAGTGTRNQRATNSRHEVASSAHAEPISARDLHEITTASVRDMLDAYRLQAQAGPVREQALEQIIYRGAEPIVRKLAPRAAEERGALLPSVVRMLLAAFLENDAGPHPLIERLRRDQATAISVNPVRGPRTGRRAGPGPSEGQR